MTPDFDIVKLGGIMDWSSLIGHTVSILIKGKGDKIENYMGKVISIEDSFMTLYPENPEFSVEAIIFHTELIKSVWVYRMPRCS